MNKVYVVFVLSLASIFLQGCATSQGTNVQKEDVIGLSAYAIHGSSETQVVENTEQKAEGVNQDATNDLSGIKVYPVPWQPSIGGKFGSASKSCGTGLIIDGIVSNIHVRIYNLQGDLAWEKDAAAADKCLAWDGKNSFGNKVASGIYIIIASNSSGRILRTTVAIER